MTALNSNIPAEPENTADLAYLRVKCFEIQTLIATACHEEELTQVSFLNRTFFKILAKSCRKLHRETAPQVGDDLALKFIYIRSIARLAIHAKSGKQDFCGIASCMMSQLNEFRQAIGLPTNHYLEPDWISDQYKDETSPDDESESTSTAELDEVQP